MKKIFLILISLVSINLTSQAQRTSENRTINTEDGTFTLQTDSDGHDQIVFTPEQAATLKICEDIEDLDAGFDGDLPGNGSVGIVWKLGTRKSGCQNGIGFRCGKKYQASLVYTTNLRGNGQPKDREFNVLLKKNRDGSVTATFLDVVDWDWLSQ